MYGSNSFAFPVLLLMFEYTALLGQFAAKMLWLVTVKALIASSGFKHLFCLFVRVPFVLSVWTCQRLVIPVLAFLALTFLEMLMTKLSPWVALSSPIALLLYSRLSEVLILHFPFGCVLLRKISGFLYMNFAHSILHPEHGRLW